MMSKHPFTIDAFVLLPDHIHCIWTLPENDFDYSTRWMLIKSHFTRHYVINKNSVNLSTSRKNKREQNVWQRRFWEHQIRNQEDFNKHVDYIHFNPVKHGYVSKAKDWEYSSFPKYVRLGLYNDDWGQDENRILTKIKIME